MISLSLIENGTYIEGFGLMVNPETSIVAKTQKDAGAAMTCLMKRLYGRKRRLYGYITQRQRQQELFDGTTAKLTQLPEFQAKAI